jgi:hypothetical protein
MAVSDDVSRLSPRAEEAVLPRQDAQAAAVKAG